MLTKEAQESLSRADFIITYTKKRENTVLSFLFLHLLVGLIGAYCGYVLEVTREGADIGAEVDKLVTHIDKVVLI